ncbi:hypothetical protein CDD83_8446 [Cordyceps sp. RAO-2017]|nr:hypothetical protein CDD83_8446 [Cordyceps sp. RAO-2017]
MLGDINKWYVKGDNGLLSDFVVESVRQITEAAFLQYQNEVEEQKRREEEERTNAEVERFRVYNISLKFFYRWKRNARAKRLQTVRLQAREQMRAYLAEQRAAARKARQAEKEAAAQAEKQRLAYEARESEDAFIARMDAKCAASREARASLMADEAMSRRDRELEAARKKAGGGSASSALSQSSGRSQPAGQPQQPARKEGPKTRALRQLLDGKPQGFRRSLPSLSSNRESPSNASPRWRLKAMGIVPLPDGTAVPESLARDMTFGRPHFTRSVESYRARRISATEAIETGLRRARSSSLQESGETGPLNKRKRSPGEESGEREGAAAEADAASKRTTSSADKRPRHGEDKDGADSGGSKPDESDYEKLLRTSRQFRMELRAFDAEMKEDTEWFRAENERMRSESAGRTAWYDDSI